MHTRLAKDGDLPVMQLSPSCGGDGGMDIPESAVNASPSEMP